MMRLLIRVLLGLAILLPAMDSAALTGGSAGKTMPANTPRMSASRTVPPRTMTAPRHDPARPRGCLGSECDARIQSDIRQISEMMAAAPKLCANGQNLLNELDKALAHLELGDRQLTSAEANLRADLAAARSLLEALRTRKPSEPSDATKPPPAEVSRAADAICRLSSDAIKAGPESKGVAAQIEALFATVHAATFAPTTQPPSKPLPADLQKALLALRAEVQSDHPLAGPLAATESQLALAQTQIANANKLVFLLESNQERLRELAAELEALCAQAGPAPKATDGTKPAPNPLCVRLASFKFNAECLASLEARLKALAARYALIAARIKTLGDLLAELDAVMAELAHVALTASDITDASTDDPRGPSTEVSALDRAIDCREAAYAAMVCDRAFARKYGAQNCNRELAMAGISWAGNYPGDQGKHLRWFFRTTPGANGAPPLPFPAGGFNLYRRTSGGAGWTRLNASGPIKPVTAWSGASNTGKWQPNGTDRLPAALYGDYTGANAADFQALLTMVARPPYQDLYYAEDNVAPFATDALRQVYLDAHPDPLMKWTMQPMTLLMALSVHPQISRLLGTYFIDPSASPNVLQDYLIEGIWPGDRTRYFLLKDVGAATTTPITPPTTNAADAQVVRLPVQDLGSSVWPTEAGVQVRWSLPTPIPGAPETDPHKIEAVLYRVERSDHGPAPAAPTSAGSPYSPLQSLDDTGAFADADPILVTPQKSATGALSWPAYFALDKYVGYRNYDYQVTGIDLFGRASAPSNPLPVSVPDIYAPPPPPAVKAFLYQRDDHSVLRLPPAEYAQVFSGANPPDIVLKVTWFVPDALARVTPDTSGFRIYYKFNGYDQASTPVTSPVTIPFSDTSNAANWRNANQWDGWRTSDPQYFVPVGAGTTIKPPEFANSNLGPGKYYQFISYANGTDLIPSALHQKIAADDDRPIVYGAVTVAAVDAPAQNVGATSGPSVVLTRDVTPPPPPSPPIRIAQSNDLDQRGNLSLSVQVPSANAKYTYNIYRVAASELAALNPDPNWPAGCTPDPANALDQRKAFGNGERYTLMTGKSLPATQTGGTWNADFRDTVDGTISQVFFYAAEAVDAAGNTSTKSCPSAGILIVDAMPPRKPVFSAIEAGDGAITLRWARNREGDLDHYELYSTQDKTRLLSKRKMALVLTADSQGQAQGPASTTPNAARLPSSSPFVELQWQDKGLKSAQDYFYRLVAVDTAGNASEMSDVASSRPFDETPPEPPEWDRSSPIVDSITAGERTIALKWLPEPGDPDATFLVQRRSDSFRAWLRVGGWQAPGTLTVTDRGLLHAAHYEYRVQAMDKVGNRSIWSTSLFSN